jgi:hypothetical protein
MRRVYFVKIRKKYLLLVILLLMHVVSTSTSDDDDAATWRWAPCIPLDDIANSDATGTLHMLYLTRAGGGGEGGRGLRTSNVVTTPEKMGTLGLWWQNDFFVWWLVRQWKSMVTIWFKYATRLIWGRWTRWCPQNWPRGSVWGSY